MERTRRCDRQVLRVCAELARVGVDVVADLGFMKREHRDDFRRQAEGLGFRVVLHILEADPDERRKRVRNRNSNAREAMSVEIPDEIFDWAEAWYETPTMHERAGGVIVKT